jgi:hypothetical protein
MQSYRAVSALCVRSRKLSNIGRSSDGGPNIYYLEVLLAVFTVVSTHQSALGPRGGLWPVLMGNP